MYETWKSFSASIRFVRDTRNKSLKIHEFRKLPASIEGTGVTAVSNVYKRNSVKIRKTQMETSASASHLQLRTNPK